MKTLQEVIVEHFKKVYEHCDYVQAKTARVLGVSIRTVRNYIKKYNLKPENPNVDSEWAAKKRRMDRLFPNK